MRNGGTGRFDSLLAGSAWANANEQVASKSDEKNEHFTPVIRLTIAGLTKLLTPRKNDFGSVFLARHLRALRPAAISPILNFPW